MTKRFVNRWYSALLLGAALLIGGEVTAQELIYYPIYLRSSREIADTLSDRDIPTGEGGFARDYRIYLEDGDQVAINLLSDNFDALVILIAADGSTVAKNDDGPDGTTNSLLFARIPEDGGREYIVRVRAFGETGGGDLTLKITCLQPIDE